MTTPSVHELTRSERATMNSRYALRAWAAEHLGARMVYDLRSLDVACRRGVCTHMAHGPADLRGAYR